MGHYIQGPAKGKVPFICSNYGARVISISEAFDVILDGKEACICVVDNGPFEAAGLLYDTKEFSAFMNPTDSRPKQFLAMNKQKAYELARYVEITQE